MRMTERDVKLVKDIALSHVLSRDQIIRLGYFSTVTRTNTRLRELCQIRVVRRIETPFFGQTLYAVGKRASDVVEERIGPIIAARGESPRFLQHALCVTNTRIALIARGATAWRFEQQLWTTFEHQGKQYQVRPDGLATLKARVTAIEVDLGNVAPEKFAAKLSAYNAFIESGACEALWNESTFRVLTVTTSKLRASRLNRTIPENPHFDLLCVPFEALGLPSVGAWS